MQERFPVYILKDLPEGWVFVLDSELGVLTLSSSQRVVEEQQCFSPQETLVLQALFANPVLCPNGLLCAAMSNADKQEGDQIIAISQERKTLGKDLKCLRAVIARCRQRLARFQLEIKPIVQEGGALKYVGETKVGTL